MEPIMTWLQVNQLLVYAVLFAYCAGSGRSPIAFRASWSGVLQGMFIHPAEEDVADGSIDAVFSSAER